MFKKVPEVVKCTYQDVTKSQAINSLKTHVKRDQEKIRQLNARVNKKIERESDKLANGIYNMSSFLFEDQNENTAGSSLSGGALVVEAVGDNSVEWNVSNESTSVTSIYDKLGNISDKTFDFIRTVPGKINDFLASDALMEPNDAHMIARK
jgi:hypothetical protein